jgi:hypothetical protein
MIKMFREHVTLHADCEDFEECFDLFVGQLQAVYAPGSIETYCKYVRSSFTWDQKKETAVMLAAVCAQHADSDTTHAPDCTLAQLRETLLNIRDQDVRMALYLMLITGMRLADICRLRRKQIALKRRGTSRARIFVQVRFTKNRRKRQLRRILMVPLPWFGEEIGGMLDTLEGLNPDDFVAPWSARSKAHGILKKLSDKLGFPVKTYSFRRHFIEVVQKKVPEHRWVDYTLHLNTKIIRAHYTSFSRVLEQDDEDECRYRSEDSDSSIGSLSTVVDSFDDDGDDSEDSPTPRDSRKRPRNA